MRKLKIVLGAVIFAAGLLNGSMYGKAAEIISAGGDNGSGSGNLTVEGTVLTEGEYTIIRINAEDDGSGNLLYAIDSDAPDAFGPSNEFTVKKGSEHTVYVKDPAGNISAQIYRVPDAEMDLEVNIGYSDTSSAAMVTDEERAAIEPGGGKVAEQMVTDTSNTAERQFFTVTTKNDHVFYLMVDQSRSDNNVYLLDQVTDEDLYDLAATVKKEDKSSIFQTTESPETVARTEQPEEKVEKNNAGGDAFLYILLIALAAAAFYYYKIYKPKQEKRSEYTDAKDIDEFENDEDEDTREILDFTVSQEEKDELMNQIMNGNDFDEELDPISEEELSYDPDEDLEEAVYEEMENETEEETGRQGNSSEKQQETIKELELPEEEEE